MRNAQSPDAWQSTMGWACSNNDVNQLKRALDSSGSQAFRSRPSEVEKYLRRAVGNNSFAIVQHLVEAEGASVDFLNPTALGRAADQEPQSALPLFEFLLACGWNINKNRPEVREGMLQVFSHNEEMLHWCLEHGADPARVGFDEEHLVPPLLDSVAEARNVSVETFQRLRAKGATLSPRTLHCAAYAGNHAIVQVLVDEGLDVNALDSPQPKPEYWGTPICYAARVWGGDVSVVRYLLGRGADPTIKSADGLQDAFDAAKKAGNQAILDLLVQWRQDRIETSQASI